MRIVLLILLLSVLAAPSAAAHPIQDCGAVGPYHSPSLWVDAWAADPIDEDGEGLHKFNSIGCFDGRYE